MIDFHKQSKVKVSLGRVVITANANSTLEVTDVDAAIVRHATGDWGELSEDDIAANERALHDEGRLLSVYRDSSGTKFYVITEADRSATTVLLPEDY